VSWYRLAYQRRSGSGGLWVLGGIGVLIVILVVGSQEQTNDGEPLLQVTAAKGSQGMSITSLESTPISKCDLTLLDQGNAEWVALGPVALAPSQTALVVWSKFTANNQQMPAHIGQNRNNFIVSCFVETSNKRRSAGLRF
jgi:hypothetical protein